MNLGVIREALPEIVTQLLGFLIVFWILKKYAFGAVFGAIDERRKTIEDSFRDIERKKSELEGLEREYREKLQRIDQESRVRIQEALKEAGRIAAEIKEKTRAEGLRDLERAKADIEQEIAKARVVIRRQVVELSTKMAEKLIHRNLSAKDDEAFVENILKEAEKV